MNEQTRAIDPAFQNSAPELKFHKVRTNIVHNQSCWKGRIFDRKFYKVIDISKYNYPYSHMANSNLSAKYRFTKRSQISCTLFELCS